MTAMMSDGATRVRPMILSNKTEGTTYAATPAIILSKFVTFSLRSSRKTYSTPRSKCFFSNIFLLVSTCRTPASLTQWRMSASVVVKFKLTAVRPAIVTARLVIADAAVAGNRIPTNCSFTPRTSRSSTRRIAITDDKSLPPVIWTPLESAIRISLNDFLHDRRKRRAGVNSVGLFTFTTTDPEYRMV